MDEGLAKFQKENCAGCRFADDAKVGTGEPCCQYPGLTRQAGEVCLTRLGPKKKEVRG